MEEIKEHDYFSNTAEHDFHNSEDIGSSDSLSGVHITGFDFINEDPKSFATMEYIGQTSAMDTSDTSTEELEDTGVCVSQEINDGAEDPTLEYDADNQCGKDSCISTSGVSSQESKERPSANVPSDSVSVVSDNSTSAPPSASTALYSCTSFGELREAMKTNLKSSSPLLNSKLDLKPAIIRNRKHNHMGLARSDSGLRPTGIMLRPRNDVQMLGATQGLTGVGARGLGIRKYASLNFDLDTIVSLDSDLDVGYGNSSADQDVDLNSSAVSSFRMMTPTMERRRVSFVDSAFNSGTVGHGPQTPSNSDGTALKAGDHPKENQSSPSWMNSNLGRYTSPTMNGNGNKLRKRRNMSTPVLLNTPHLQEKVELPAGLEQIGMGIGYTYNRPRVVRPTMAAHVDGQLRTGTPRRSVSLGSSVARCGALLTNFTRGRTNQAENLVLSPASTDRTSEESETIDPMMREVYGPRWGADFGLGPLVWPGGAGGAPLGAGTLRGRVPGRVYSVDENADESGMDSTLRLVDSVQREEF
ncbi:hypothetical protein PHLCEN_2v5657 [Hermanssonia centrifuga]|uniref:Uncharacterized protein n=1 Tax=Hermanssonia centrifuga TaxID=98765 RepID=A0A2R6P1R1_9APHY|nr:hypothetical protein PHLCEN_2v5657 [Hermanssonia centrifuga]